MAAIITIADLQTHIYSENLDAISRGDDTLITRAIAAGIDEAKSYLSVKYDVAAIFADTPGGTTDQNLLNKTKDLAAWHLIKLANPNINLELFRTAYEDAIDWFTKLLKGQMNPVGWPLREDDPDTDYEEGGSLQWSSNTKRNNQL